MASRVASLLLLAITARAWEEWCGWVPVSVQEEVGCTGAPNVTFQGIMEGCVDWCQWVPVMGWMYVEECSLCVNVTIITNVTAQTKSPSRGLKTRELHRPVAPAWCRQLPPASLPYVAKCAGLRAPPAPAQFGGAQCQSWCQWVPQLSWQDPPGCRGCTTGSQANNRFPAWCSWVPPLALKYIETCAGLAGPEVPQVEGCTSWCIWVSGPAWHHVHECHTCSTTRNATNATDDSEDSIEDIEDDFAVDPAAKQGYAGSGHHDVGLKVRAAAPDWCRWVPPASLQYVPDCTGFAGSSYGYGGGVSTARGPCESWCQWVPRPSWQYPPGCRGCV